MNHVTAFSRVLQRNLIGLARSDTEQHLRVLKDRAGYTLAQKLYSQISPDDFSKFPAFYRELDNLMYRYGAETNPAENNDSGGDSKKSGASEDDDRDKASV